MADNLESYFKKHLSDETPGDDQWNVPSDEVWDKALPEIRERRGIFIPWKYIYLSGALLVAGLALILWLVSGPGDVAEGPGSPDAPVEAGSAVAEIKKEAGQEETEAVIAEGSEEELQPSENTEVGAIAKTPAEPVREEGGQSASEQYVTAAEEINKEGSVADNMTTRSASAGFSETQDEVSRQDIELNRMFSLGSGLLSYEAPAGKVITEERISEIPPLAPEKERVQFNNRGRFGLGAFYAPTWNTTNVIGEPGSNSLETGSVYLYSGNIGAEFRFYVSRRLSIHTGFERSEVKSWSRSEVDFAYDASTESEMPDGKKENTSALPMATPFGEIGTRVTYRFPGQAEIPDGEPMQSVLEAHQEVRYFSVPLGVEYTILPLSRFNWFGEGGIRYNRAYRDATEFDSRVIHFGEDMSVVAEEMENHPSYTENFLNFYVGTGVNYQFSRSFLVTGSARYFRNITKVNVQGDISTDVQGFGMKFGFIYIF